LAEVLIATVILAVIGLTIVYVQSFMSRQSVQLRERVFATEKSIQVMEQLRALVSGSEKININVLDDYDDGTTYSPILTSDKNISDPAHPISGNKTVAAGWKYLRRISVVRVPEEPFARKVYVRFYRSSPANPAVPGAVLAETVSILKTISSDFVPTMTMDVYIIAVENVPGWWSSLSTMVPMFESVLSDLQTRNPGLILRTHWIRRLAYGRDRYYKPYINNETYTNDVAMPLVYFYPGLLRKADNTDFYFYDPEKIQGQINIDGVITNPESYNLCDQYNHAVRYPDEVRLYDYNKAQAVLNNQPVPEISLRMLLEQMNSDPASLKNILLVNLHGELLPLPPMRNYSDAAKDPANYPHARLVTHPEQLSYAAGSQVKLRVYPYTVGASGANGLYYSWSGISPPSDPFNAANLKMSRMDQSINFDWSTGSPGGAVPADKFSVRWTGTIHPKYSEIYTFKTVTDDGVRLSIDGVLIIDNWNDHSVSTNTCTMSFPFTAGQSHAVQMDYYENATNAVAKLCWSSPRQEEEPIDFSRIAVATVYVPSDTINTSNITVQKISGDATTRYQRDTVFDLSAGTMCVVSHPSAGGTLFTLYDTPVIHSTSSVSGGLNAANKLYGMEYIPCPVDGGFDDDLTMSSATKNTARWIITLAPGALSTDVHAIETRIGDNLSVGTSAPFYNLSRTYVWVGVTPPATEQFQFIGDPRHCPYLDVKQAHGYNWYFRSVPNTANSYSGFTKTAAGWGDDGLDVDVPRFFQTYRSGLLNTQAIWSAMNGFSYYYYGVGGEFGSDIDPLPNAIPFIKTPWSTTGETSSVFVDEILPYGPALNRSRIVANTLNSWYAKYWLGELYPDDQYSAWISTGNIATGAGKFYRANHTTFSDFDRNRTVRTGSKGCSSFINGKASGGSGPFCHESGTYTGTLTALGLTMSSVFNFPLLATIDAPRPFVLDYGTGNLPTEWNDAVYQNLRTVISIPSGTRIYYDSTRGSPYNSSAVIKDVFGSSTCYIVASGLATQADFGTVQMGKFVLMSMIQGFLDAGLYTGQDQISQIPMVSLTKPLISDTFDNPGSIHFEWAAQWQRWDGQPYTADYSSSYSESTLLGYSLKYSPDRGVTWYYCSDNSLAVAGGKDAAHLTTATSYDWPVTAFSRGSYIVSIECYRQNIDLHYSYDQIQIYINK